MNHRHKQAAPGFEPVPSPGGEMYADVIIQDRWFS